MYKVAKLKKEDRKDFFDKYIADFGGTPAIVEKDFEEILGNKPIFVIDKNEIGVLNFFIQMFTI